MKNLILTLLAAGLINVPLIGAAVAQTTEKELSSQTAMAEYVVGPCRFKIANMFGGSFEAFNRDSPPQGVYYLPRTGPSSFRGSFALRCVDASAPRLNGKYVDGRWWTYGPVDGPEFVPYEKEAKARTIPLKGKNWTGIAYTADATTGDESGRARFFYFCLVHDAHALCGDTVVKWLADRKGRNDLDRIKAILESVEFVDTPAPAGASATPGATSIEK